MSLHWHLPGPDEPGHLRRRRELAALVDAPPTPTNVDALADYLLQFAKVDDPDQDGREYILDLPELVYKGVIIKLLGYEAKVPDPKGGRSGPPSDGAE